MDGFQIGERSHRFKIVLNIFTCCITLYFAVQRSTVLRDQSPFESWIIDILAPIQKSITSASNNISDFRSNYFSNVDAKKRVKELEFKLSEMESRVFELEQQVDSARSQNKLIGVYEHLQGKKTLAKVISIDSSNLNKMIRLDKGKNQGVSLQSAVVTHQGVVGFVYRLSDNFSDVLTILDSKSKIDGLVQRTSSHGIIEGDLKGQAKMKYVRRRDPVVLDDLVVTSGLGNIYPHGVKVGRVAEIQRQSYGISQRILIEPIVDFKKLQDVLILAPRFDQSKREELQQLDRRRDE